MSIRTVFMAFATLLVAVPSQLRGQDEEIDFGKARREFVAGQPRNAANSLLMASLGVRQQVGRCRDVNVGTELLNAESNLEKLATALRAGTVKNVKELDEELAKIDLFLAQHHLLLVKDAVAHPRGDNIATAARDLDRLAYHFERSLTLGGKRLNAEQAAAVADALKLSKDIAAANAFPGTVGATLPLIEKQVLAAKTPATP